jgi:hypothetical protein
MDVIHAKDLAFENHYMLDDSTTRRTSQPRVATNTPKEIVGSSGDKKM